MGFMEDELKITNNYPNRIAKGNFEANFRRNWLKNEGLILI
jgi:hypothetical protein